MKNFHQKLTCSLGKCSILLHISHFVAFRQLEGVFKRFLKMILSACTRFGYFPSYNTKFQSLIRLNTGEKVFVMIFGL